MPVREFLRRLSSAGRSRASSSATSPETVTTETQTLLSPLETIPVNDTQGRTLSAIDDQYPQISSRKFEQPYRTRWPSCSVANGAFGPGGSTALLEALKMDNLDGVDEKDFAKFTKTLIRVEAEEDVYKLSSTRTKNGLDSEKEMNRGFREGNDGDQVMGKDWCGKTGIAGGNEDQDLCGDVGFTEEIGNNEDLKDRDIFLDDEVKEISTTHGQTKKTQGLEICQAKVQLEDIDPVSGKIALRNEDRGALESRARRHYCIVEGHLFAKPNQERRGGKTKNMVEDKGVKCEVCRQIMKKVEILVCDLRVCKMTSCFECARRMDNERKERALESWRP